MTRYKTLIRLQILLIVFIFTNIAAAGQSNNDNTIMKAMKDELNRSIEHLELENLQKPFFISYNIYDAKTLAISSSLGAIIGSEERPLRSLNVKVLVGDYDLNNANFQGGIRSPLSGSNPISLEDDYNGIRIALWKETDRQYKTAAESYENKLAAMKQQNLGEEMSIPDLQKSPAVKMKIPGRTGDFERKKWEGTAKEISSVFNDYGDIFSSKVKIVLYRADAYYINSEGTEVKSPISIAAVKIAAQTMAEDGEPLYDHLLYYAVDQDEMPDIQEMRNGAKAMADMLIAMRNAPVLDEDYAGPILFEDQAAAELFSQSLFAGTTSLYAKRKPIFGDAQMAMYSGDAYDKNLESSIGRKVISREISIKSLLTKPEIMGEKLIGGYGVDMEGIIPDDELVLVEDGVLKTLLNNRTPTAKVAESNGHYGPSFQMGRIRPTITPGIISITTNNGKGKADLKDQLIAIANEEDLDYAFIVRKLESRNSGIERDMSSAMMGYGGSSETLSKPLYIYKVSLEDGKEELVRSAKLGEITIRILKKMTAASKDRFVYNSLVSKSATGGSLFSNPGYPEVYSLSGIPASFIVPDGILFDDLDVFRDKRVISNKLPVVKNPVGGN